MTAATIFSGGGGADIGLSVAGLDVRWGIEYDDEIASVARENGLDIRTEDVTEADAPSKVDVLHASPPCPNFSVAKTGGEETDEDVSLAEATVKFIRQTDPDLFTLENVWGYRKSQSWKLIREHLQRSGYDWNAWKLNCADYGVPQTRKRMIVAARKGGARPKKPPTTHAENPSSGGLFGGDLNEWVGWYEAVEDLIPDLPETELADWQIEQLPDDLVDGVLCQGDNGIPTWPRLEEPPQTLGANEGQNAYRAVLVDGKPANFDGEIQFIEDAPMVTVSANTPKHPPRAVLFADGNASSWSPTDPEHPSFSIAATAYKRNHSARVGRRVVQMTPRCLARFQTFPDDYDLPESKSLACRIIGNAVPPLAMKKWVEAWT